MALPLIVGISGASGVIYGIETLRILKELGQPVHLIISKTASQIIHIETGIKIDEVHELVDVVYHEEDMAVAVSSGSFKTRGMIVAPCSIKTLSGIANAYLDTLIIRAADVCLKERRRLILMVRETPLHQGHLETMAKAARLGAVILPPIPCFYHCPETILDLVRHSIGKALDQFNIEHSLFQRWNGKEEYG